MHMADALISPTVGGVMTAASLGLGIFAIKKIKTDLPEEKIPLMGVLGAFIFAAQMINFTIIGTGSSGHLGGGLLLAILLGRYAGFLTIASVLIIQALFFADGGLLALGCNIFNLGFYPCFIVYPLIYQTLTEKKLNKKRIFIASILGVVVALQMGAFSVVLQTLFSGQTLLPFIPFLALMQPIHLAIGLVEGVVTALVVNFIYNTEPSILMTTRNFSTHNKYRTVLLSLVVFSILTASGFSLYASEYPDGLEWSITKVSGVEEIEAADSIYATLGKIQASTSFLPDYNFQEPTENGLGTSVAGLVGGLLTLTLAFSLGTILKKVK